MKSKDQVTSRGFLQFIYYLVISDMIGDELTFPMTEWMRACCADPKAEILCNAGNCFSENRHIFISLVNVGADICSHLNNSLVHFRFHFILDHLLAFIHNFLLMAF